MRTRKWTPEKIDFIRCHLDLSDAELGEHFDSSKAAVKTIRAKYGISRGKHRAFSQDEETMIRELYSDTNTAIIAEKLGRSISSIYGHAQLMGVKKSKAFIRSICILPGSNVGKAYRFHKGHVPANKGKKMDPELKERIKHTFFQKGHIPPQTKYDGCISIRKDKRTGIPYQYIRIGKANWEELNRHIWEKVHGPIPKGFNVVFKDGNVMNCIITNLELISDAELMRRNSIQRYPPEVKKSIRLVKKLERTIKKKQDGTE